MVKISIKGLSDDDNNTRNDDDDEVFCATTHFVRQPQHHQTSRSQPAMPSVARPPEPPLCEGAEFHPSVRSTSMVCIPCPDTPAPVSSSSPSSAAQLPRSGASGDDQDLGAFSFGSSLFLRNTGFRCEANTAMAACDELNRQNPQARLCKFFVVGSCKKGGANSNNNNNNSNTPPCSFNHQYPPYEFLAQFVRASYEAWLAQHGRAARQWAGYDRAAARERERQEKEEEQRKPMCRYGAKCDNRKCNDRHPASRGNVSEMREARLTKNKANAAEIGRKFLVNHIRESRNAQERGGGGRSTTNNNNSNFCTKLLGTTSGKSAVDEFDGKEWCTVCERYHSSPVCLSDPARYK